MLVRPILAGLLPLLCLAQGPSIGVVEVFGARGTPAADILRAVNVRPGGRLPASRPLLEQAIADVPGIQAASVEAACCEDGKAILYIGIAEEGEAAPPFREPPTETPDMPEAVSAAFGKYVEQGSRAEQERFPRLANEHADQLRTVLRTSGNNDHRAVAVYILGYQSDRAAAASDLIEALRDPDSTVRGHATRALAQMAKATPGFDASPLIDLLNSHVWADRSSAATALVSLTETRNMQLLGEIRRRALPALIDMARWTHRAHALPAYTLLGRTAWIPEADLQAAWAKGERDRIIEKATASPSSTKSGPRDRR